MLTRLLDFFADRDVHPDRPARHGELQAAAAALLVEAAQMDDAISPAERDRIVELVRWRFGLSEAEARELVADAERAAVHSVEAYGYTATIRQRCTEAERVQLIEMLWDIAYADGRLHDLEASLLRRIAGLLYVSDQDSGAARKRVVARYGLPEEDAAS